MRQLRHIFYTGDLVPIRLPIFANRHDRHESRAIHRHRGIHEDEKHGFRSRGNVRDVVRHRFDSLGRN